MKKSKILILDDEELAVDMLNDSLCQNYRTVCSSNALEAIKLLEQNPDIDLIISDQRMPEMTGIEFLKIARDKKPDVPRILLTGYSSLEDTIEAINAQILDAYLTKPYSEETLLEKIKDLLRLKKLEEENARLIRDITEVNSNYELLINSIPDCLIILRQDLTVHSANNIGLSVLEANSLGIDLPAQSLFSEEDCNKLLLASKQLQHNTNVRITLELKRGDSPGFYAEVTLSWFQKDGDRLIALLSHDISTHVYCREILEQELQQKNSELVKSKKRSSSKADANTESLQSIHAKFKQPFDNLEKQFNTISQDAKLNTALTEAHQEQLSQVKKINNNSFELIGLQNKKYRYQGAWFYPKQVIEEICHDLQINAQEKLDLNFNLKQEVYFSDPHCIKNALKHTIENTIAFSDDQKIQIDIQDRITEEKCSLVFRVTKKNSGTDQDKSHLTEDPSLSLSLSKLYLGYVKSELAIESSPEAGTSISFTIEAEDFAQ